MGHKSAQVVVKVILFSCLAISLSWLISEEKVHADSTTSVIIKLANGSDVSAVVTEYEAAVVKAIPGLNLFLLESNFSDLDSQLANDVRVDYAHENAIIIGQPRYVSVFGNELDAQPWESGSDPASAYQAQWAVSNIRLPEAHSISQGEDVTVAVLDTGIDFAHEQFQGKLVDGYDFVDDDAVPAESRDGIDQDGDIDVDEGAGHGTHVAGIIALTAPQAKIMPIRIFDDEGHGLYFDLVAGIMYAVDNGADVINLSGSGVEDAPFLAEAIAYAEAQGVVVVAAGGVNSFGYPASYDSVVSVGASNELDYPTDFSDFPEVLDNTVYAPGFSIISGYDDGSYAVWTGNSMATPFVAGTTALLLATESCDDACAKVTLLETAHLVVDDPGTADYYGRIDAFDAVSAATDQFHTDLNVMFMDGDSTHIDALQLKPYFNIVNNGNSLLLDELTLRYWFTKDSESEQLVDCDFAAVQCDAISNQLGVVSETAVSDTYLELDFDPDAGILLGNHDTGNIQMRVHKSDWTLYDEDNDYSYNGATVFTESQKITLYHNGNLVWGEEPVGAVFEPVPVVSIPDAPVSSSPPVSEPEVTTASADVRVQYRTYDTDPSNGNIMPHFQLVNDSANDIPLSELRLRYWFTDEETTVSQVHCDYAGMGCGQITAVINATGTQHALDITFSEAAGQLGAASISSQIHTRINHTNWQPHNENDDHSFLITGTDYIDWQNVTLYRNGTLIWGVEP